MFILNSTAPEDDGDDDEGHVEKEDEEEEEEYREVSTDSEQESLDSPEEAEQRGAGGKSINIVHK